MMGGGGAGRGKRGSATLLVHADTAFMVEFDPNDQIYRAPREEKEK